MTTAHETEFHEKISDLTECSICAEIFTNPKTLPCLHTFCLHCLEIYGKEKKPGDQMACPICRNDFVIPDEGLSKLPINFFIGKIVEIGKLATVPAKEAVCDLCCEQEAFAKKFCIDCEQRLCHRCSKSHIRTKNCQNHQVVELGTQLNLQEFNLCNSYCEHHPKELIKMYCYEDKVAVCLICCFESHQSHRCVNVDKAVGDFTEQLKEGLTKVTNRLLECEEAFQKLDEFKKEFTEEVLQTENSIRNSGTKLKELIDQHTETLVQNLRSVTERNLKFFEITAQDVERFRVMIDSYDRYCKELLARGSSVDICRTANQMLTRAHELGTLPANCGVDDFYCDTVAFQDAHLEILLRQLSSRNAFGEITVTKSSDRILKFQKSILVSSPSESVKVLGTFISIDLGFVNVITKYLKEDLQKIEAELKECSGNIDTSKDEPGFVIKGNETGVRKAEKDLLKLVDRIVMYDHDIDRPGLPAYFYSKHGKVVLRGIQMNHKASIQLDNSQMRVKPQAVAGDSFERCRVEVRPGKFMTLMRGDITKCRVDAIVNAANEDLKHYGGVAAAIAEAAGFALVEDCLERIKLEGKLLPGQACVTRAGKLPCKKVIHAVGPRWSGGHEDEENILLMAVDSSLSKADGESFKSVAMPSISTGIFGFPLDRATDIIVDAVKSYFVDNSSTTVREVFFIDNDSRAVASLERKLRTIQAEGPPQHPESRSEGGKSRRATTQSTDSRSPTHKGPPKAPPNTNPRGFTAARSSGFQQVSSDVIQTAEGVKVTLVKGSISTLKADVLVNTTGKELNLSHGNVSKSLLDAAGPTLQAEVNAKKPGDFDYGQIVVTGGHKLRCKHVYHGSCRGWDNGAGNCERIVRTFMKNLLEKADSDKQKSIAIPAIGTGNLKIPHKIVAEIMYSEVEKFSSVRKPMNLLDVQFVVYDKDRDSIKAFEDKIRDLIRGGGSGGAAAASYAPTSQMASSAASYTPSTPASSRSSSGPDFSFDPASNIIRIGSIKMTLKAGDITSEKADAIINSTNERLDMTGGAVAKAILRAGGKAVERECKRAQMSSRRLCVTSGGYLPAKSIIHLVAGHNQSEWEEVIQNALEEAEDRSFNDIVFPMLGTGQIGASASSMAGIMLDAVCGFCKTRRPRNLKEIRVCIFQKNMLDEFIDAVARRGQGSRRIVDQAKENSSDVTQRTRMIAGPPNRSQEQPEERQPQHLSRIILSIYALSMKAIQDVLKDIEDVIKEYIVDKVLENPQDQESIAKLNPEQIQRMKRMTEIFPVQIEVETGRLKRIRIRGPPKEVMLVIDQVHAIYQEAHKTEIKKKEEEWFATVAQWEYEDDRDFEKYPDEINAIIEKAYRDKKPYAEWEEENAKYRLTFKTMVEEFMTKTGTPPVKVRRVTKEMDVPSNWETMKNDEVFKSIQLSANDQEYKDVEKAVLSTAQTAVNQIVKIERIQCKMLYKQYILRKAAMDAANPGVLNELTLWHGTSADTVESINQTGFNRSYCGKNAVVYGRGVYFAKNFSYSASNTYSPPDANGYKHVYLCKVLTGEYAVGNQSMIVPPSKPGSATLKYDSTVDTTTKPTIFVIFYDTQAYPEYLIYFK